MTERKVPHVVAYISSHGYGHFGQLAPVVNALRKKLDIKLTLVTALPAQLIASRLLHSVEHIAVATDFGMRMISAFTVDMDESYRDYRRFHQQWPTLLDQECERLKVLEADLVIANVPYLPLAAAARLGVPSLALCSLNWAEIFWSYFHDRENATVIRQQILDCYNSADTFLCPQPSMPMPLLANVKSIGPIAATGTNRREEINDRFHLQKDEKIIMIVPGGIPTRIPLESWATHKGIRYVLTWDEDYGRDDFLHLRDFGFSFADALCSCDAVVTKPGYGMVAETACNGVPALYATRGDWPEEEHLVDWWQQHANTYEISHQQLMRGDFQKEFSQLAYKPSFTKVEPSGIMQVVGEIQRLLLR